MLIRLQRYDEAIVALKRNTELQPMSPYGWYQLARVHIDKKQPDEAVKIIRHLKGFEPKVAAQLERETGLLVGERANETVEGKQVFLRRPSLGAAGVTGQRLEGPARALGRKRKQ